MVFGADGEQHSDDIDAASQRPQMKRVRDDSSSSMHCTGPPTHTSSVAVAVRPSSPATRGFTDWGRDTFISMRGLCLSTGRLDDARSILTNWAGQVSEAMLPNRFPDDGQAPEFNSVDASLWFIIAVHDYSTSGRRSQFELSPKIREQLWIAIRKYPRWLSRGTRYRIQMDPDDGCAGRGTGIKLTWMDARVGDHDVTPRIGKPRNSSTLDQRALDRPRAIPPFSIGLRKGTRIFLPRYWNKAGGCLRRSRLRSSAGRNEVRFVQIGYLPWEGCPFHWWPGTMP